MGLMYCKHTGKNTKYILAQVLNAIKYGKTPTQTEYYWEKKGRDIPKKPY
jgi:hypothetical protein